MRNMNSKKLFCLVIVMIIATLSVLSSCAGDKNNSAEQQETESDAVNQDSANSEETAPEDDGGRANYKDSLPDGLDFGGAEYRILVRNNKYAGDEFTEQEIGEVVNDAIYKRQKLVEERLNVTVKKTEVEDTVATAKKTIKAGDDAHDVIAGYAYYTTPLALDGYFVNLSEFPNIDYEKPWWPDSITENLKIANKLYFITGDYTLTLLKNVHCLLFNKTVAQNFLLPNLYQTVLNGDWTLDEFGAIVKSVSQDLNGDDKFDVEDMYGIATLNYDLYFSALQIPVTETADDGILSLSVYTEKFVSAYDKLYEIAHDVSAYSAASLLKDRTQENTLFINDRVLFWGILFEQFEDVRGMQSDYGILPYPKYNKSQDNYYTVSHDNYSLLCVPVTADPAKYEMIGAFTEAVAAEGYRSVTPSYFDIALKNKYSRDDESSQVPDIILAGVTFQPAVIYSNSLGDVGLLFRGIIENKPDISSNYEKSLKTYEKALEKFNVRFAELN